MYNSTQKSNGIYSQIFKRGMDFIVAFIALIILMPIMLILIFLLLITGHRKFFFVQQRVGYKEKLFYLVKFRSMTEAKDVNGLLLSDEIRLTNFGKWMRKTSLDELPQLFNVLKGDMSIIGPRPLLIQYLDLYSEEQKKRHWVRPGITGWAQVNGRNAISWNKKFEFDVWYEENINFFLDFKIIFMTIKKIFVSEGINQQGQATVEAFNGKN
jgi:lipopolysaccharide/colanic/teichoic acid biosynthesis glycosyltransferase